MNSTSAHGSLAKSPIFYWRLWLLNAVLVSAGLLFFLATQYGTWDFFGKACLMALLPFIPVLVLVGGAGSTIFVLTKVLIERRSLRSPAALTLLVGPGLVVVLLLGLMGVAKSPRHRLAYICLGNAPKAASQVQVTGYATFLRAEWLAVFNVGPEAFQTLVAQAKLTPVDEFEIQKVLGKSALLKSRLFQEFPQTNGLTCYKRVFKEAEERERGGVYAVFDPASSKAGVYREYHD